MNVNVEWIPSRQPLPMRKVRRLRDVVSTTAAVMSGVITLVLGLTLRPGHFRLPLLLVGPLLFVAAIVVFEILRRRLLHKAVTEAWPLFAELNAGLSQSLEKDLSLRIFVRASDESLAFMGEFVNGQQYYFLQPTYLRSDGRFLDGLATVNVPGGDRIEITTNVEFERGKGHWKGYMFPILTDDFVLLGLVTVDSHENMSFDDYGMIRRSILGRLEEIRAAFRNLYVLAG
jgi:hypothetical protein